MQQHHGKGAVRHAEKRRTSTCRYADRIAMVSKKAFQECVPLRWREQNRQTCIATVVAHFRCGLDDGVGSDFRNSGGDNGQAVEDSFGNDDDSLGYMQVMGLGVGTKFLSEELIRHESNLNNDDGNSINDGESSCYGRRIRDSHAEVLARRAFRLQLTMEMMALVRDKERGDNDDRLNHRQFFSPTTAKNMTPGMTALEYRPILKFTSHDNTGASITSTTIQSMTNKDEHNKRVSLDNQPEPSQLSNFTLIEGVTLHFYTSSAPCGNATVKKFATLTKERYRSDLGPDVWPSEEHVPIPGHSRRLGQFALLLKKDASLTAASTGAEGAEKNDGKRHYEGDDTACRQIDDDKEQSDNLPVSIEKNVLPPFSSTSRKKSKKNKNSNPNENLQQCPPGTTTPQSPHGSLHTCSDKVCRWNVVGIQGSLLASLLEKPLYMTSLTVGRKFTECICRRAVCCRAVGSRGKVRRKRDKEVVVENNKEIVVEGDCVVTTPVLANTGGDGMSSSYSCSRQPVNVESVRGGDLGYRINHPAIMGTAVYLDETGVINMSGTKTVGQNVRFLSNLCWIWCPSTPNFIDDDVSVGGGSNCNSKQITLELQLTTTAQCIDGETGLVHPYVDKAVDNYADGDHNDELFRYNDSGQGGSISNNLHPYLSSSYVSTFSLTKLFLQLKNNMQRYKVQRLSPSSTIPMAKMVTSVIFQAESFNVKSMSLRRLRALKRKCSPTYERQKDDLFRKKNLSTNPFGHWKRREESLP